MTLNQKLIILIGCLGITINFVGIVTETLWLNLLGILIQRLSGALYNAEIGKLKLWVTIIPFIFGILSVIFNSITFTFAELMSASIMYQITAYQLFKKLNN